VESNARPASSEKPRLSRREALKWLAVGAAATATAGCALFPEETDPDAAARRGRLLSRPGVRTGTAPHGRQQYAAGLSSSFWMHVPASVDPDVAAPLMLFLHGAGRDVPEMLDLHEDWLEAEGVIMMAPYSTYHPTWDALMFPGFSADPPMIDLALARVFADWTIDPARIACAGFSDGASYSIGLGRANGDLFTRIVAYSPGGFLKIPEAHGKPPVLVSHGTEDNVLPYVNSTEVVVPSLEARGHAVDFRSFVGGHTIPADVAQEVVETIASA
jgi:phospholipase/carboxylesterase